jgi:hypothetical protein
MPGCWDFLRRWQRTPRHRPRRTSLAARVLHARRSRVLPSLRSCCLHVCCCVCIGVLKCVQSRKLSPVLENRVFQPSRRSRNRFPTAMTRVGLRHHHRQRSVRPRLDSAALRTRAQHRRPPGPRRGTAAESCQPECRSAQRRQSPWPDHRRRGQAPGWASADSEGRPGAGGASAGCWPALQSKAASAPARRRTVTVGGPRATLAACMQPVSEPRAGPRLPVAACSGPARRRLPACRWRSRPRPSGWRAVVGPEPPTPPERYPTPRRGAAALWQPGGRFESPAGGGRRPAIAAGWLIG